MIDLDKHARKFGRENTKKLVNNHFKSHRDVPKGRNFHFWNSEHDQEADDKYRDNFDSIFPNAPGSGM